MTPVAKSALFEWDFEREALHLCVANPSAAQRFVEAVDAGVELLAQHPEIGPVWRYGNPNHPLVNSSDMAQFKFAHQTSLVNAFNQTRSFEPVNFNGRTDSDLAQLVSCVRWVHVESSTPRKQRKRRI